MKDIFAASGVLARHLPNYEPRPGQQEMARAVAELLVEQKGISFLEQKNPQSDCLIVEAETGLGKTLAYLVPAVLSGRRVVVSTNTRNLQDQILSGEIPYIQKYIAPDLTAMCVKGRQNYLCLYRWHQLIASDQQELFTDKGLYNDLRKWLKKTVFADRAEFSGITGDSFLWRNICCQPHFCLGSDCPDNGACHLNRLRRAAASCQLLVVNHHLLFSDLAVRRSGFGEVLPRYESVIFDEAHHLENVATHFFGFSFSKYQVIDLVTDIEQSMRKEAGNKRILASAHALFGLNEQFVAQFPVKKGRFPLAGIFEEQAELEKAKDTVLAGLGSLAEQLDRAKGRDEPWEQYLQRCQELEECLERITAQNFREAEGENQRYIHWVERTEKNLTLSATPIDVADDLKSTIVPCVELCLFTPAPLSRDSGLFYFSKRLGIPEETATFSFPSPFDYPNRSLLYIPDNQFPEPADSTYRETLHRELRQLISHSRGRALLLFTSFQAMDLAWHSLRDAFDYTMLRQGTASRHQLLTRFAEETDSVLFAVASFWEGVDVPGEALSMVVIDKLPFEVPSDPVIMARIDRIKAAGGNPFLEFQVPRAVLSLRQGVGRLMRCSEDQGVMAILDVRLFSKFYGRKFLTSLPAAPVTRNMEEVRNFFDQTSSSSTRNKK
jgi:ATP-dependent DNA helicase DinG